MQKDYSYACQKKLVVKIEKGEEPESMFEVLLAFVFIGLLGFMLYGICTIVLA